ncbi:MAG: A/G-specific adenine glycosylase [Coleofasciculaceae cyanobacterium SM2_3_26]|nr:A/G-specific adenine glycosylase [Coleofasciculaceae cyanobacterium SM2_3_26]
MPHPLTCDLLHWYDHHRRDLPWRDRSDPYAIWVSEIMLQQTRAETVIPYFQRWLERFPTVFDLAAADLQEVLSLWEGLGYYSRARNLHRAATIVVDTLQGQLPESAKALQELPGIGTYTAGAIASIGFGQNEPALDGNGRRVLARWFDVAEPVNQPKGDRRLQALAREYLPPGRAGDFNQAVMDFGRNPLHAAPTQLCCLSGAIALLRLPPGQSSRTSHPAPPAREYPTTPPLPLRSCASKGYCSLNVRSGDCWGECGNFPIHK